MIEIFCSSIDRLGCIKKEEMILFTSNFNFLGFLPFLLNTEKWNHKKCTVLKHLFNLNFNFLGFLPFLSMQRNFLSDESQKMHYFEAPIQLELQFSGVSVIFCQNTEKLFLSHFTLLKNCFEEPLLIKIVYLVVYLIFFTVDLEE